MAIVIDPNSERGTVDLEKYITNRSEEFYLSAVTASELLHGLYRATNPAVVSRRTEFVEELLRRFPTLPIDLAVARIHAKIYAELAKLVRPSAFMIAGLGRHVLQMDTHLRPEISESLSAFLT
jgi:predicted nucleic acid-binding protein